MTPPALLLKLRALPWRLIGAVAVVLFAWWQIRAYADRVADAREAEVRAEYKAADERATAKHNERIAEVETTYDAKLTTLQAERDAALARPATRLIRVPIGTVCPPASPSDASVPQPDPGHRLLEVDDPGYGRFQDWLTEFAGRPANGG